MRPREYAPREAVPVPEAFGMSSLPVLRVFLAEDNEGDVFLVRRALQRNGVDYELVVARNGEEALKFVSESEAGPISAWPHIFILDLNLPRFDGIQILSRIRSSVGFPKAPVIILTSSDSPHDRQFALEGGANEYFRKPNDLESFMKLGDVIRNLAHRAVRE